MVRAEQTLQGKGTAGKSNFKFLTCTEQKVFHLRHNTCSGMNGTTHPLLDPPAAPSFTSLSRTSWFLKCSRKCFRFAVCLDFQCRLTSPKFHTRNRECVLCECQIPPFELYSHPQNISPSRCHTQFYPKPLSAQGERKAVSVAVGRCCASCCPTCAGGSTNISSTASASTGSRPCSTTTTAWVRTTAYHHDMDLYR